MENKNKIIAIGVAIVIIIAGLIFWYWSKKKATETVPVNASGLSVTQEASGSIGATIFEKSRNPVVDKLPETNPFGKIPINPLKSVYTNPFQ